MALSVLINNTDQAMLDTHGFVKVPLLNPAEVEELKQVYEQYFQAETIEHFTSTNLYKDTEWRKGVAAKIDSIITAGLTRVFQNVKFWLPAFLIKPTGENTEFQIHQDWTFVDEEKYCSGNIWIPLSDTDSGNGTLHFLPGSHYHNIKTLRAHRAPYIFKGHEEVVKQMCRPVAAKAGEAIIFYHSTIHYSTPNLSDKPRIAVVSAFNSADTSLKFHYLTDENVIEEYSMPDNFVFNFESPEAVNKKPGNGQLVGTQQYQPHTYTESELKAILTAQLSG